MKTLTKKSEITAKKLKTQDCSYKGKRLGFDKSEKAYFVGSLFHRTKQHYQTIENLKIMFPAV